MEARSGGSRVSDMPPRAVQCEVSEDRDPRFHLIRYPLLSEVAVAVILDHQPGAAFQPFAERLQADEFEQGADQSAFSLTTDGEPVSVPLAASITTPHSMARPDEVLRLFSDLPLPRHAPRGTAT